MRVKAGTGNAEVGIYTCGRDTSPPPSGQFIIDVAGLRDPGSSGNYRHAFPDGRAGAVQEFVAEDPRVAAIREQVILLTHDIKSGDRNRWVSFVIKDHHGKWISPAVGEILADSLSHLGYKVAVCHYELETIQ